MSCFFNNYLLLKVLAHAFRKPKESLLLTPYVENVKSKIQTQTKCKVLKFQYCNIRLWIIKSKKAVRARIMEHPFVVVVFMYAQRNVSFCLCCS